MYDNVTASRGTRSTNLRVNGLIGTPGGDR